MLTSHQQKYVDMIHCGINPYDSFEYTASDIDLQGWGSTHPLFEELVNKYNCHKPVLAIEVGTWKGGSARYVAGLFRQKSIDGVVICIDTWLAEEVLWRSNEWRPSLRMKNGRPNVYQTFMANTVSMELQDYIIPVSMPSLSASRYLKGSVLADFIYIDGCHIEGDVYRDIAAYWKLLKPGGSMLIDDYVVGHFDGLIKDVHLFASEKGLKIRVDAEKCLMEKP